MKSKTKFKQTEIGKIPEDWEVKTVKEVAAINKLTINKSFLHKEIEYIDIDSVNNGFVSNIQHLFLTNAPSRAKRIARANDTIISTVRPNLKHFAFLKTAKPNTIASTGFAVITSKKIDPRFLYYYLTTDKFTNYLSAIADSHTSTYPAFNPDVIESSLVPFPSPNEQCAIASILGSLDDKIELNRSMNATLGAIGQALFKHWFVDFEFPNEESKPYKSSGGEMIESELGEIPKGWEILPLGKIAEFTRGFSYAGSEKSNQAGDFVFITLNSVYEGGGFKREFSYLTSERVKERHLVKEGDIIIANTEQTKTGTLLGFPALVEFPRNYDKTVGVFSHHITKVAPYREEVKYFLYNYLYFYQSDAVKYHTGSVIWALDVSGWTNNEKIITPKKEILVAFSKFMNTLFQQKLANNRESNNLEKIRDSLLPKLMSGEIRVKVEAN